MDDGESGTGSPDEEAIPSFEPDPSQGPANSNAATSGDVGAGESSRDADEDKQARPPKPPESAKGALAKITERRELSDDDQGGAPGQEGENLGPATLSRFLTFYPCTRFFCALAHRQYSEEVRPDERVARMRKDHKKLYWTCVLTDYLIVVISVLLLLGAAGVALYKTLWLGTPGLPWNGTSGAGP